MPYRGMIVFPMLYNAGVSLKLLPDTRGKTRSIVLNFTGVGTHSHQLVFLLFFFNYLGPMWCVKFRK
jgi:hypothetical protein